MNKEMKTNFEVDFVRKRYTRRNRIFAFNARVHVFLLDIVKRTFFSKHVQLVH